MSARIAAYRGISLAAAACLLFAAACSSSSEPSHSNPIVAVFQCGDARVETRFMNRRMALFLDGKAYALQQAESGSGARYTGRDLGKTIEFWNKGNEAMLTFGEKTYPTCIQASAAR